jgi:hypothetical protein
MNDEGLADVEVANSFASRQSGRPLATKHYFTAAINDFSAVDTRGIEGLRDRRDLRRTDSQLTNQRQSAMSAGVVDATLVEGEWTGGEPQRRPSEAGSRGAVEQRRLGRAPPRGALGVAIHPTGSGRRGRAS